MLSSYARPVYDEREKSALMAYVADLANNWMGEFEHTAKLEDLISKSLGIPHAIATNTGTSALYAAYHSLGIQPNDEVLVSAYTFIATATPARMLGADIRLVDIEPHTLGMSAVALKKTITNRTKCVVLTPINGRHPDGLKEIVDVCRERKISLVEDCASAFGSTKFGKPLGTWGDVGITSFSTAKVISAGQGGALFTKHDDVARRVRKFKNFGRSEDGDDIFDTVGLNFKLGDMHSIVAAVQIEKLDETHREKTRVFERYIANLGKESFPETDFSEHRTTYVDFMGTKGRRHELKKHLKSHGVGSRLLYPSLNEQPVFQNLPGDTAVAKARCNDGLLLPSAVGVTNDQVDKVCALIQGFLDS